LCRLLERVYFFAGSAAGAIAAAGASAAGADAAAGAEAASVAGAGAATGAGAGAGASAGFWPQAVRERANRAATRAESFIIISFKVKSLIGVRVIAGYYVTAAAFYQLFAEITAVYRI
jgi:hypothetical protein